MSASDPFATTLYGLTRPKLAGLVLNAVAVIDKIAGARCDGLIAYDQLHEFYVKASTAERLALVEAMMLRVCKVALE